jgi:hypothetical protein
MQELDGVELFAAADPGGDRHRAPGGRSLEEAVLIVVRGC